MCISLWGVHIHHYWTPIETISGDGCIQNMGKFGKVPQTRLRHRSILARHFRNRPYAVLEQAPVFKCHSWMCSGAGAWYHIDIRGLFAVFHGKEFWVPFGKSCFWGSSCMWFLFCACMWNQILNSKHAARTDGTHQEVVFQDTKKSPNMDGHIQRANQGAC